MSPEAKEELQRLRILVGSVSAAEHLWTMVFNQQERTRLGGSLQEAITRHGIAGMWKYLRKVSLKRAIVDVSHVIGLIDLTKRQWLLREIGEDADQPSPPDCPSWSSMKGELRWKGRLVRKVRGFGTPSNIQIILDAFQSAGWPQQIANPLTLDPQQLHQALRSLNNGLKRIRFRAHEGGQKICWEIA